MTIVIQTGLMNYPSNKTNKLKSPFDDMFYYIKVIRWGFFQNILNNVPCYDCRFWTRVILVWPLMLLTVVQGQLRVLM